MFDIITKKYIYSIYFKTALITKSKSIHFKIQVTGLTPSCIIPKAYRTGTSEFMLGKKGSTGLSSSSLVVMDFIRHEGHK